ncbi:hypothetical protein C8A00DRAFT_11118 [Chaetomidium leptoderma]|uniref:Uncharacterized protein n=1 Tax=Chaetomidium leptoderma TaxID=669021 RepID=A0AAN7A1L6_9PEZI|nr:hypothetical protein C8A00DRAFT_11118 [Chaetomidium leptoderma]
MAIPDEHQDNGPNCSSTLPPLSISQLVARYPRERLLVHPLCWSDRQLTLLGCRIHSRGEGGLGAGAHENAEDRSEPPAPDGLARLLARRLNRRLSWGRLIDTILKLLWPLGGGISLKHNQTAHLYFNQRSRAEIQYCRISVSIPGPALKKVTFACFDIDKAVLLREFLFRPPKNRRGYMDLPGLYRLETLLKRHTPADRRKDPYLVALVIALAQQERRCTTAPPPPPPSFTVGLFLSPFLPPRIIQFHYLGS